MNFSGFTSFMAKLPLPTFLWPEFLWLLLAIPVLVLIYIWLLRRKKKMALRYASLSIVREAMGRGQGFRRHVPPILFLLSIAAMLVAASRPFAVISLPSQRETIILAMDVSGSMRTNSSCNAAPPSATASSSRWPSCSPMPALI
jgi:Ca-activated chloride channel homolog